MVNFHGDLKKKCHVPAPLPNFVAFTIMAFCQFVGRKIGLQIFFAHTFFLIKLNKKKKIDNPRYRGGQNTLSSFTFENKRKCFRSMKKCCISLRFGLKRIPSKWSTIRTTQENQIYIYNQSLVFPSFLPFFRRALSPTRALCEECGPQGHPRRQPQRTASAVPPCAAARGAKRR